MRRWAAGAAEQALGAVAPEGHKARRRRGVGQEQVGLGAQDQELGGGAQARGVLYDGRRGSVRRESDRRATTEERDDLGLGFHARARRETGIEVHGETCVDSERDLGVPVPGSITPRIQTRPERVQAGTALALSSRALPYGLQIGRHRSLHGNPLPLLRPPSTATPGAHLRPSLTSMAAFPAFSRALRRPSTESVLNRLSVSRPLRLRRTTPQPPLQLAVPRRHSAARTTENVDSCSQAFSPLLPSCRHSVSVYPCAVRATADRRLEMRVVPITADRDVLTTSAPTARAKVRTRAFPVLSIHSRPSNCDEKQKHK